MTYTINTKKEVSAKEFGEMLISQIMERLDKLSAMNKDESVELLGSFSEVADFTAGIYEDLKAHKLKQESAPFDYERQTGHEMGVAMGRV